MRAGIGLAAALVALALTPAGALAATSRLSISGARVTEGDSAAKRAVFTVTRSAPRQRAASVRWATASGSAKAGADFVNRSGTLRFRRGQRRKTISISVRADTTDEPNESFFVRLSRARGARIKRGRANATIVDNDPPPSPGGSGGGGATPGGGGPATPVVRFIAFGNQGEGNAAQNTVAGAMAAKCAASGCDFVAGTGNNFYDNGVDSTSDPQWNSKFVTPYASVAGPFYMALGNHDYGGNGTGTDAARAAHQVNYSAVNPKWIMPANHHRHAHGHTEFVTLDTTPLMFTTQPTQASTVSGWLNSSTAAWKIVIGHHPYRSNGPHGNAGDYDGQLTPPADGTHVKNFLEANVCGKAHVYISGHDQSLQWPSTTCNGTELIVTGTGSKTTTLPGSNPTHFQSATLGFVYFTVAGNRLTAEFIGSNGASLFTRSIER